MKRALVGLATLCLVMTTCLPRAHGYGHSRPVAADPAPSPSPWPGTLPSTGTGPLPSPAVTITHAPDYTGQIPTDASSEVPAETITVKSIIGATPAEIEMIGQGVELANAMVKTPCFRQWVLAASYTENNDLSQPAILAQVASVPTQVDIEMYTGDWKANHVSKTIGYENDPFDGVVHMNRYFVHTPYMVGDNVIHEDRGHSLGFHHFGAFATSQPYGMNYAYEGCSHAQEQQMPGAPPFKPPGIRLEIRHKR